jgi:hypothetical protein
MVPTPAPCNGARRTATQATPPGRTANRRALAAKWPLSGLEPPTLHSRAAVLPTRPRLLMLLRPSPECLARPPATRSRLCRLRGGGASVGGASGGFRIFLSPYAIRSSAVLLSPRAPQATACVGAHSPRVPVRRDPCEALPRPGLQLLSGGALPRPPASAASQRVWTAAQANAAPCDSSGGLSEVPGLLRPSAELVPLST